MTDHQIEITGRSKGIVYRKHGRWRWFRNNGATQVYPRDMGLADVRDSIARECRVTPADVTVKH